MTIAESSEKQHRLDQIVRRNQVLMDYARNVAK